MRRSRRSRPCRPGLRGAAWSVSSIIAYAVTSSNHGDSKGYEALYVPVVGPFIAMGTTGAFESKNNASDFGVFLLFDGLAQTGGVISLILGSVGDSHASDWARSPAVPRVAGGVCRTQLT